MGMKQFTDAALLHFPNFIGLNGSNSECETSHFTAMVTLVSQCKLMRKSLLCMYVITRFGHYES